MIDITQAIFALSPTIAVIHGDVAYDQEGNKVFYDAVSAQAKLAELEAQETTQVESQATAKASALAKLTALGLSEDEVKALVG